MILAMLQRISTVSIAAAIALSLAGASLAQPAATPEPFDIHNDAAGNRWIRDQNIDLGPPSDPAWLLLGFTSEGAVFVKRDLQSYERQSRVTPRAVLRLERYGPAPSKAGGAPTISETTDYDISCNRKILRQVQVTEFTNRNTAGASATKPVTEDWRPVGSDVMMETVYEDICEAEHRELEATAGQFLR